MQNLIWCLQNLVSPFFSSASFSSSSLPNPLQDFCQRFRERAVRKINTTKLNIKKKSILIWKSNSSSNVNKRLGKEGGNSENFLQVLSNLFYTQTPAQPGISTQHCQIVTLYNSQCSSPGYYLAHTSNNQIQQLGGTQESAGTGESNLLGNSVTTSGPIYFPFTLNHQGHLNFRRIQTKTFCFQGVLFLT